jgi:tetratricopeptide (TPR) repeat protein
MASQSLLALAKSILRQAAEIGIEEAGTRICGSMWPTVKKMLTPVMDALQKRYPKLLLAGTDDAKSAAEAAANDLSNDASLQKMLSDSFSKLEEGQAEILDLLSRNSETLKQIGDSIDRGFKEAEEKNAGWRDGIMQQLQQLQIRVAAATPPPVKAQPQLSTQQIFYQANTDQQQAIGYLTSGDLDSATKYLEEARALAEQGVRQAPGNADMLATMGYIEKTQAQVCLDKGNADAASVFLDEAAKYFTHALQRDPGNVSALNGMANVYALTHDYDRAIKLGRSLFDSAPDYSFATFDLTLSLEEKIKEANPDPALIELLRSAYERLIKQIPQTPGFPSDYLPYVQQRLAALNAQFAKGAGGK